MKKIAPLHILPLIIALLLFAVLAVGIIIGHPKPAEDRMVGQSIIPFEIPELGHGKTLLSPDAWKNKIVVVNFFASWCVPCQAEHEALMKLSKTGKVAVFGVAWKDKEAKVAPWLSEHGNPYHVTGIDETGQTTMAFALTGVPETFVIGSDGIIRYHYTSALTDDIVNDTILPLVEQLNHESKSAR